MYKYNGMHRALLILIAFFNLVNSVYIMYDDDYEEATPRQYIEKFHEHEHADEPEPVTKLSMNTKEVKNIMCEDFETYNNKCTSQANLLYDSRNAPPMSHDLIRWCAALKSLFDCEHDWNVDCKDVTDKIFDEETVNGQIRIIDRVCNDEWFLERYDISINTCVAAISDDWKYCYNTLKLQIDQNKNFSRPWTHYESHFYLCCARTRFRRCTLENLLHFKDSCAPQQAIILQKFSSIISEGAVFQDCNFNMVYQNCPHGDPRPSRSMLTKFMGEQIRQHSLTAVDSVHRSVPVWYIVYLTLLNVSLKY